jgi:N-acetylmuramoyl-L-alanine amidase
VRSALRAGKRALPVGALALLIAALAGTGCAVLRCRPPVPPRPAPGYDRLRDSLATLDAGGLAGRRIVLDPGHGGFFRGALGVGGLSEAGVNLEVARALRDRLVAHGALVLLTREDDRDFLGPADSSLSADLAGRARRAAAFAPDLLISIHHNADPHGAHDVNETQTYYRLGDEGPSLDAAQDVHRALVRNVGIRANRVLPGNYYILRTSVAPALLTETSYITNPDVERRLRQPDRLRLEADALFVGLARYFARHVPAIVVFAAGPDDDGRGPILRATIGGAFDEARLDVDGIARAIERDGPSLWWRPAEPLANGPHRATLSVRLAGEGAARPQHLAFTVTRACAALEARGFPALVDSGGGLVGIRLQPRDIFGLPVRDTVRVRWSASRPGDLPRDTVLTIADGEGWGYARIGRQTDRRVPEARFDFREIPAPELSRLPAAGSVSVFFRQAVGDATPPPVTTFLRVMPADTVLRDAPGLRRRADAEPWLNRDGFAVLPRDSSGAVRVPALAGYRPWPSDSALPPRFVAVCGGALHGRRIVLDPEGGGGDPAGQGPLGTRAANLDLECARILAGFLEAAGAEVRLTREGDFALSDVERVQAAEAFHAERYLRIAHAAAPPRLGAHPSSAVGRAWAARTAAELAALGLPLPAVTDEAQYVIQQTSCPALYASAGSLADEAAEARLLAPGALRTEAYALFLALAHEWAPAAAWPADSLTVLDGGGRPLAGASVRLGGTFVFVTDASGRIRFARTEPGPVDVVVEDPRAEYHATLLESQRGAVLTGTTGR